MAKSLHPTKMRHLADYSRKSFHIVLDDPTVSIDDLMTPSFWQHHTNTIDLYALIDVIGEGFDVQLRATEKGIGFVKMRMLRRWEDRSVKPAIENDDRIPDGYVVDHHSKTGWRARLRDGGVEIARQLANREAAIDAAIAHHAQASVAA